MREIHNVYIQTTHGVEHMLDENIAEMLAEKQKEISVSEFFERNKHVLGFDSPVKSLITAVKEGVDNALDACEEAGILPEIRIEIRKVEKNEYLIAIQDNGPGIVKRNIPKVFGQLLYGSRFHAIRQSRGQQGIGISGVVMYSQLTTGRSARILSKTAGKMAADEIILSIDTKHNRPEVVREDVVLWDEVEHGTRIEVYLRGRLIRGRQSVYEYLRRTAIVNPHAKITYIEEDRKYIFERATERLPKKTVEIKPHPYGVELGTLLKMIKHSKNRQINSFLMNEFSRVSPRVADEICSVAGIDPKKRPKEITVEEAKALINAMRKVRIMAPPSDCLSPIGAHLIKKGLRNVMEEYKPEYYVPPVTREPAVYSGNPFQVEVGMVYGGNLPKDQPVEILRFANRVPLLYQQGACAITHAIERIKWRQYGLEQRGGKGIPSGPAVILVHIASTRVPFTSEAKEAVADIPEIIEEIDRALKECARHLRFHIKKQEKKKKVKGKFEIVQKIIPEIARKSAEIVGKPVPPIDKTITKIMGILWVDSVSEYGKGIYDVKIKVINYMEKRAKFSLYAEIEQEGIRDVEPEGRRSGRGIVWDISLKPTESLEIRLKLKGEKGDYDDVELYTDGINPVHVIGAEPLPGDWNVERAEIIEVME